MVVVVSQGTRSRTHPRSLDLRQPGTHAACPFVSFSGFTRNGGGEGSFSLRRTLLTHMYTHTKETKRRAGGWRRSGWCWWCSWDVAVTARATVFFMVSGDQAILFYLYFLFFFTFSLRPGGALLDDKEKKNKNKTQSVTTRHNSRPQTDKQTCDHHSDLK